MTTDPNRIDTPRRLIDHISMFRLAAISIAASFLWLCSGCTTSPEIPREPDFGPSKLRIHPTFTQPKDWNGDKKPDGIEVVVELLDSYGEPTRGNGTLIFELWSYRKYDPNILGKRVVEPWRGTLLTREEQDAHWSKALRAYTFQLATDKFNPSTEYVLTASFETAIAPAKGGGRLFDQLIIEPPPEKLRPDGVGKPGGAKRQK